MAKCPNCGWRLSPFASKSQSRFQCPQCNSILELKSYSKLVKVLMLLVLFPMLFLLRIDEQNTFLFVVSGLTLMTALFVLEVCTDKLRLADENEF